MFQHHVGLEATCKHSRNSDESLNEWTEEYCSLLREWIIDREDRTQVLWQAICKHKDHKVLKTVKTVFYGSRGGIGWQLLCKFCNQHMWPAQVRKPEVQLAVTVAAKVADITVVPQAVLLPKKAVDVYWPEYRTVAEVDDKSHKDMHKKDRELAQRLGRTKAEYDASVTERLEAHGYTVFRLSSNEVLGSGKLDALVNHLQSCMLTD